MRVQGGWKKVCFSHRYRIVCYMTQHPCILNVRVGYLPYFSTQRNGHFARNELKRENKIIYMITITRINIETAKRNV